MAKEELLEFPGVVSELLPNATFRVKLENDHAEGESPNAAAASAHAYARVELPA